MSITFLFYIFLLLNLQIDTFKPDGNTFYSNIKLVFSDSVNYFSIFFVVSASSAVGFLLERLYGELFSIGVGLLKNPKFREGFLYNFFVKKKLFLKNYWTLKMLQISPKIWKKSLLKAWWKKIKSWKGQ